MPEINQYCIDWQWQIFHLFWYFCTVDGDVINLLIFLDHTSVMFIHYLFFWYFCTVDGDLSINKLLFIQSRAYNKDSASLIASGPRAHIHFWNVFQGGTLMAQFPGVGLTNSFNLVDNFLTKSLSNSLKLKKRFEATEWYRIYNTFIDTKSNNFYWKP